VRTTRGRWLVKTTPAPAAWQLREMRVSGSLERAAYEAGVPMPTPAQPTGTGSGTGERPPEPELIHVALVAYAEAGGAGGPARVQAFAGLVRATLGTLAYELWLAAGHRTATANRRAAAAQSVRQHAARLPVILSSLDSWSRLIR
jgi:hypothetical protein